MLQSKTTMQTLPLFAVIINHQGLFLGAALIIVLIYALYLDRKISKFTKGNSGASLEEVIASCIKAAEKIEERNELISKHAVTLEDRVSHAIRNVETMRYKAFDQNSSNQSFSIALLNEQGNGVIISSLHSHDRMSTFAKPIVAYESDYELTEEEEAVIANSKKAHKKSPLE